MMKCRANGCPNEASVALATWPLCKGCDLVRRDLERHWNPCHLHQKRGCNHCYPTIQGRRSPPPPIETSKTCGGCGCKIQGGKCAICGTEKSLILL